MTYSEMDVQQEDSNEHFNLTLYVAGQTPKSVTAFANLKKICEEHLQGRYTLEVIDLMKHPELAQEHQILALPTVVRRLPTPMRKLIGDLSNTEKTMVGMQINARSSA